MSDEADVPGGGEPGGAPTFHLELRPEVLRSSRPVIGPVITALREAAFTADRPMLADVTRQLGAALTEIGHHLDHSRVALASEAREREVAQRDIASIAARLDGIERQLDALQIAPRLARMERAVRTPSDGAPTAYVPTTPETPSPSQPDPADPGLDYLAFEARFRGPEAEIRDRQAIYLEILAGRRRVADLGCGRGELLELLRERGISAYGVEVEPDFIALLREKSIEVSAEDLVTHLDNLEAGVVDALVASHVIEHLPPRVLFRFITVAHERLPDGGVLIMETPNPESLLAGSVNFHRDPTHVRPVHPDTLAFLAENAGFRSVEVRRLSPVPDAQKLPLTSGADDPLSRHLDSVVAALNRLIFGYQDYAVIATR